MHPSSDRFFGLFSLRTGHSRLAARKTNARLVVLYVAVPRIPVYGDGIVSNVSEPVRKQITELIGWLHAQGIQTDYEPQVSDGDPATEILHMAHEMNCDLIVMGTHGRKGLSRLLMGSVAEEVLRKAQCPVLVVKDRSPEALERLHLREKADANKAVAQSLADNEVSPSEFVPIHGGHDGAS